MKKRFIILQFCLVLYWAPHLHTLTVIKGIMGIMDAMDSMIRI